MMNVFSGRNLIDRGRFKQYRMIAPQDTTFPAYLLIPTLPRYLGVLTGSLVGKWVKPVNIHGKNQVIAGPQKRAK